MQRVCLTSGPPHAIPLPRIFFLLVLSRIFFLLVYHDWPCSGTLTTSSVIGLLCSCLHSCAFSVTGRGPQLYTMLVSRTRFPLYPPESSVPTLVSDIQLALNKYFLKDGGRRGGKREGGKREGEEEEPPRSLCPSDSQPSRSLIHENTLQAEDRLCGVSLVWMESGRLLCEPSNR